MIKEHIYFQVRKLIESLTPFKNLKECEYCKAACKTTTNRIFLFDFEVKNYPLDKLTKIGNYYFIKLSNKKPVYCPFLSIKENKRRCSIHKSKPLSCVLEPVIVHEINSKPYWIFDGECPLSSKKENIEKAKEFVKRLEKVFDESITDELSNIASTIAKNIPFEKKHIILLKKIKKK
jgi:Fe-S-cluster containining protein